MGFFAYVDFAQVTYDPATVNQTQTDESVW
jgi:hypothetical protein